jgi:hypothetical protein
VLAVERAQGRGDFRRILSRLRERADYDQLVAVGIVIDAEDDTGMNTLIDRVFLKGNRLYQLGAIVPRGTERDAVVTRFLDSAHITAE